MAGSTRASRGALHFWLLAMAVLIAAMVLVGGATRLTGAGLSIVEWRPVTGTLPPLSDDQWQEAFSAYQQIPQYRHVNAGMTLSEFKSIFWWEWSHRLLGRLIGVAYLLPFLWFIWRGGLERTLQRRLWLIFALGALQGAVGWWMVASGLTQRVEVAQERLAVHLTLALAIFAAIVFTLQRLAPRQPPGDSDGLLRLRLIALALLALTFVQVFLGALVAGLRAGQIYNTWPLIDGALLPGAGRLWFETPWWRNLFDNQLTVQFNHRMTAYALVALAVLHAIDAVRCKTAARSALLLVAVLLLQVGAGVLTLLHQVPIGLGLLHQALAILVLTLVVVHFARLWPQEAAASAALRGPQRAAAGGGE